MDKKISFDLNGPVAPPNSLRRDAKMRQDVEARRDDRVLDTVETAGIRRMRDHMARFVADVVPIRGDAAWRLTHGLSGTLIAPGRTILIWIDGAAYASPTLLADALFHEAIHATGRAIRNHAFLPDDRLHPQEHLAEEIVALFGANLVARFVGFDLGPIAGHNRQQAVRLHANYLLRSGWKCDRLFELKRQARHAAMFLADEGYNDALKASIAAIGSL